MSQKVLRTSPAEPSGTAAPGGSALSRFAREAVAEHLIWPIVLLMLLVGAFVPGFLSERNLLSLLWGQHLSAAWWSARGSRG